MKLKLHPSTKLVIFLTALFYFSVSKTGFSQAQPMEIYFSTSNSISALPFNFLGSIRAAWIYTPQNFPNSQPGLITKVYFLSPSTSTPSFNNVKITMGPTGLPNFSPNSPWLTGGYTVFNAANITPPLTPATGGINGNWIGFDLDTPFTFDNSANFYFDIEIGSSLSATTIYSTSIPLRQNMGNISSLIPATQNSLPIFGFDWIPAPPCNAPPFAGTTTANPQSFCAGNSTRLQVDSFELKQGQTYQWQSSTDSITWVNMPNDTNSFLNTVVNDTTFFRLAISCNSHTSFSNPVRVDAVSSPLNGTYTINKHIANVGNNFSSFQDFIDALDCRGGVSGPVNVEVAPGTGPYNERVIFTAVLNASATNTITINGNGNTLTHEATAVANRTTLNLDGAQFFTFDSLTIQATGTTFGWGVHLANQANNNTIRNCSILVNSFIATGNSAGIVASSTSNLLSPGNNANNLSIENNTIIGGAAGIMLNGNGTTNNAVGNTIRNNVIRDQHAQGIFARSQTDLIIFGNDISRPTRVNSAEYSGIRAEISMRNCRIENNRVHSTKNSMLALTTTTIGIDLRSLTSSMNAAEPVIVANNQIYNLNGNGLLHAVNLNNIQHAKILHNTISIDVPNAVGTGVTQLLHVTSGHVGTEFKNNILYLNRGTTGQQHFVSSDNPNFTLDVDHNSYFAEKLGINTNVNFGIIANINYPQFSDWQAANNGAYDQNSIYENPAFIGGSGNDFLRPGIGAIKNMGTNFQSLVPVDYDSVARPVSPDPGAYQFDVIPCSGVFNVNTDSIYAGGAVLSWTSTNPVNEWQLEWGNCGFVPGLNNGNLDSVVTNNTNYNLVLPAGQCFCVFIREKCPLGGYSNWSTRIEVCTPYENDSELLEIQHPKNFSCGDSLMEVTVIIRNNGFFPITNMPVTAEISGDITTTLNHTYSGNLLQNEVDTVVIGTLNTSSGAYLNILCYTALANDQFTQNDSLSVDSVYIFQLDHTISDAKICPGEDSVSVSVISNVPRVVHAWYDVNSGGTPIGIGNSIRVSRSSIPLYLAYFNIQDTLHTTSAGVFNISGSMADFVIHNPITIYAFDMYPSTASTTAGFEIYYKTGSYFGFERNDTAWTLLQSYTNQTVAAGLPHRLELSMPLTLSGGATYSFYLTRTDANIRYANANNEFEPFVSNDDFEILGGVTLRYPFGGNSPLYRPRIWNGTVVYGTETCSNTRIEANIIFGDTVFADFDWTTISHTVSFRNTSVNADSVKWYFADLGTATGDSVSFLFPETNSYQVCMVAFNECGSDTICKLVWAQNISVDAHGLTANLEIFPNPNTGSFSLSFLQESRGDLSIELIDLKGKTLFREITKDFIGTFSKDYQFDQLAAGTYMIRLHTAQGIITRRVVISQ